MKRFTAILMAAMLLTACQKEFLETKPDKALLIPTTLADCRALLDNLQIFNRAPGITGIADGDFVTTDAGWQLYTQLQERNSYIWEKDIYGTESSFEWNAGYQQILYANVVLDALTQLSPSGERDEVEGIARFYRAWAYYGLVQLYGKPYSPASVVTDPGLPLRRSPDVKRLEPRSTLQETYAEIFSDLAKARQLLPGTSTYTTRPTRTAVLALYARIHLVQGNFNQAYAYADSALKQQPALLDYNTLNAGLTRPFPAVLSGAVNPEIIFHAASLAWSFTNSTAVTYCDPAFYASYASNDLRRTLFWRDSGGGKLNFRGQYTGSLNLFSGLATDELYLTRAECAARAGQTAAALGDLNSLLSKRWKTGTFVPLTAPDVSSALRSILAERRKELVGRSSRWADLRRLNQESSLAVTLTRQLNGSTYTLEPGSPRYTYPIPPDELLFNPIAQIER
jgi:tetratricopeptide (TPR) repeat protein